MKKTDLTLLRKRQLTYDVWELKLGGDVSAITAPGQFVNLAVEGQYLRRPISVCDWDSETVTLIIRQVGGGTKTLTQLPDGAVIDTLVGLGNGFSLDKLGKKMPVLIGGGLGCAPLYGLAKRMKEPPVVAMGFASQRDVYYQKELEALGCRVLLATVDGSAGHHGMVTELIPPLGAEYAYCCGPEPMLHAVWGLPCLTGGQFSFEARMGCGFGACMGCSCETKYGAKRICKDGPVLEKEEILW